MTATIHDLYDLTIAARLEPDVMAQALARTWSYVRDEHPWAGDGAAVAWYRFSADRIRLRTRVWTMNDLTPVGCNWCCECPLDELVEHLVVGARKPGMQIGTLLGGELTPPVDPGAVEEQPGAGRRHAFIPQGDQDRAGARRVRADDGAEAHALCAVRIKAVQELPKGTAVAARRVDLDFDDLIAVVVDRGSNRVEERAAAGPIDVAAQDDDGVIVVVGDVQIHDLSRGVAVLDGPAGHLSISEGIGKGKDWRWLGSSNCESVTAGDLTSAASGVGNGRWGIRVRLEVGRLLRKKSPRRIYVYVQKTREHGSDG